MEDFIATRVSRVKKDAMKDFTSVKYEAPKKKTKTNVSESNEKSEVQNSSYRPEKNKQEKNIDPRRQQELEMKRARYEVMKFGMSGFEKVKARKAKVALAISLGAKPPKNRRVNYKVLKSRTKQEKEASKKEEHVSGLSKSLIKHKTKKTRKKDTGILGVYGKVESIASSRNKS